MNFELYPESVERLPNTGEVIIACQTDKSITVYQAYRPSIADYAIENQRFGGDYSFSRMSWIKPNFLWMMYRSGWATKEGQEKILAITIAKERFEEILTHSVHSSFTPALYSSLDIWKNRMETSEVRLQWDPDHDPFGNKLQRRAVQLGLKGSILRKFGTDWIESIIDLTGFVTEQRAFLTTKGLGKLRIPYETVYISANNLKL